MWFPDYSRHRRRTGLQGVQAMTVQSEPLWAVPGERGSVELFGEEGQTGRKKCRKKGSREDEEQTRK